MKTVRERIIARIKKRREGSVFSPKDFLDLGSRPSVDKTLSNLTKEGVTRRIGRGLYDRPKRSRLLREQLGPDIDQAAQAIARKHRWTIAPAGATAANLLGLSQQVPAKIVYLSDGPSRRLKVGGQVLAFRHANPKDLRMPNYSSRLIAQALRFVGRDHVTQEMLDRLRRRAPKKDIQALLRDARYGTDWILDVARQIAEDDRE